MNNVNKTLYIPLYGKAYVSKKEMILKDKKAEEIWDKEGFRLKGKSKSKWLAYFMGMRSKIFDCWVNEKLYEIDDVTVVHIGCGLDSRVLRVGTKGHKWYDVDFPEVIHERKLYFEETEEYRMIMGDARAPLWLNDIPECTSVVVILEGVSMYLKPEEVQNLIISIGKHFDNVYLMMDCYTEMSARLSKYKNPINDVGVTKVYGTDDPEAFATDDITFVREHNMTPEALICELKGMEKFIFKKVFGGKFSKKMYRLFEYKSI